MFVYVTRQSYCTTEAIIETEQVLWFYSVVHITVNKARNNIQMNFMSFKIPYGIGSLVNLSTLSMSRNNFSGGIPSSIQNLTNLETLELENNSGLSGEIPTWLFHLQKLRKLRLGGNKLQWNKNGSIFPQSKLTHLSLSSCGLEGKIPDWLKNQTDLYFLDLSLNRLEGSFPKWLADLKMENIILSDNRLSGSLSPSLFQSLRLSIGSCSIKKQLLRSYP